MQQRLLIILSPQAIHFVYIWTETLSFIIRQGSQGYMGTWSKLWNWIEQIIQIWNCVDSVSDAKTMGMTVG